MYETLGEDMRKQTLEKSRQEVRHTFLVKMKLLPMKTLPEMAMMRPMYLSSIIAKRSERRGHQSKEREGREGRLRAGDVQHCKSWESRRNSALPALPLLPAPFPARCPHTHSSTSAKLPRRLVKDHDSSKPGCLRLRLFTLPIISPSFRHRISRC